MPPIVASILAALQLVLWLWRNGGDLAKMVKDIGDWIGSIGDEKEKATVTAELVDVMRETQRDWKRGERRGAKLRDLHSRMAIRFKRGPEVGL